MQKKVESVIASARMLMRKPSEQAMPSEDMRLLLHNLLERYTQQAIQSDEHFTTHEFECDLEYSENLLAYDVIVSGLNDNTEFDPIALFYQKIEDDENNDDWVRADLVDYKSFTSYSDDKRRVIGAFYSNNWDGTEALKLKLNLTEEGVAEYRWRLGFRLFPDTPADFGDYVAFPPRFTTLLEYALAQAALPLVFDDSASYNAFRNARMATLSEELSRLEMQFSMYLTKPQQARIITSPAFHYRRRNALIGNQPRIPLVERG